MAFVKAFETFKICFVIFGFHCNDIFKQLRRFFKIAVTKCCPRIGPFYSVDIVGAVNLSLVAAIFADIIISDTVDRASAGFADLCHLSTSIRNTIKCTFQ